MNAVLRKIIDETLRFKLTSYGVFRSTRKHKTDWTITPMDVLAYLPAGRGEITFRDTGECYSIANQEAILATGGKVRKNCFYNENGELLIYWAHVRYEIMNCFNLLGLFHTPQVFTAANAAKIGRLIKQLIDSASNHHNNISVSELAAQKALGMELLAQITSVCALREDALQQLDQYRGQADLIGYIESHLKDKISVSDLAARSCLSTSRFHRVFKAATKQSPNEFISGRKIQRAQTLLTTTNMSLTEIADETGFANVYYFSRIFKQYSGLTPAAYRNLPANKLIL